MKKANPTALGLFLVIGLAFAVGGVLLFSSGTLFHPIQKSILYFDGSLKGLNPGAPVKFRGVTIGKVDQVLIRHNQPTEDFAMPVIIAVDKKLAQSKSDQTLQIGSQARLNEDIRRGFRARLDAESLVTGVLYAAATLYGTEVKGGYEYDGKAYDAKNDHVPGRDTCTGCHEPHNPGPTGYAAEVRTAWASSAHGNVAGAAWVPSSSHKWIASGGSEDFSQTIPTSDCLRCHTADGFVQFATGSSPFTSVANLTGDPKVNSPLNCKGCHNNDSFTVRSVPAVSTYYNVNITDKVTAKAVQSHRAANFPDVGQSNICIACHSARVSGPNLTDMFATGNWDLSNASFQNSHYMGASGTMYMEVGFKNFTTLTAPAASNNEGSAFASSKTYNQTLSAINTTTPDGVVGGQNSAHRRLGTPLIAGSESYLPAGGTALTTNGPCVTCHMKAFNPIAGNGFTPPAAGRPAAGHSLAIDEATAQELCLQCHADAPHLDGGDGAGNAVYTTMTTLADMEHAMLEPHVTITWLDPDDRLVIRTSTQIPFHVRRQVAMVLQIPLHRVHVIKPRIGGGFGGKQEVLIEDVAAHLTIATGRPVRFEYTRGEEFYAARSRHPMRIHMKTGVTNDGKITANSMYALSDTGAYGCHALTVTGNTGHKAMALYTGQPEPAPAQAGEAALQRVGGGIAIPNIRFYADIVYTNTPPAGASTTRVSFAESAEPIAECPSNIIIIIDHQNSSVQGRLLHYCGCLLCRN